MGSEPAPSGRDSHRFPSAPSRAHLCATSPTPSVRPSFRDHLRRERSSFGYALRGLRQALRQETHLRFHAFATVVVIIVAATLPLSRTDWALLAFAIGGVWTAELLNTGL